MYWKQTNHLYYIWLTSHVSLLSAMYGYMNNATEMKLWLIPLFCYVNSVNYWRKPEYGLRRNVDIVSACSCLIYQNVIVYNNIPNAHVYWYLIGASASMYPISYIFYWMHWYKMSTMCHILLHIIGNIAHISLYE